MTLKLDKDQRRRLRAYYSKQKPYGWRNCLDVLSNGPAWKAYGLYYECVRSGGVGDSIFRERWSVGGDMPPVSSVATQTEQGLAEFLASIRQRQLQKPSQPSADPFSTPEPSSAPVASLDSSGSDVASSGPKAKPPRAVKENKRTVSLMIEPSLYDRVKQLAELQERSVGAQIRHAIRQDLDRNAHLLGESSGDE